MNKLPVTRVVSFFALATFLFVGSFSFASKALAIDSSVVSDTLVNTLTTIDVDGITPSGAMINVAATNPVSVRISYWRDSTSQKSARTVQSGSFAMTHSIPLLTLATSTRYQAQVVVTGTNGKTIESKTLSFTTKEEKKSDTVKPIVKNVVVSELTNTSVILTWETNELTSSIVWYGQTKEKELSPSSTRDERNNRIKNPFSLDHSVVLSDLKKGTRYTFSVGGADEAGNIGVSTDNNFITKNSDTPDPQNGTPILYNLSIGKTSGWSIGAHNNRISWKTNEVATTRVTFSDRSDFATSNVEADSQDDFTLDHTIDLKDLKRKTFYYFRAESKDKDGNQGVDAGVLYIK